jgi:tetrahydromethanopterin S-methyltransferase subunit F
VGDRAAALNAECHSADLDRSALDEALRRAGQDILEAAHGRPHLFSDTVYFVSAAQMAQMQAIIKAVESVANRPDWIGRTEASGGGQARAHGVFYGYDFHLNAEGAHLIEINTNAGGAFLNAVQMESQQALALPGEAAVLADVEQAFVEMFRNEWRIEQGDRPLHTLLIADEKPQEQYLYPEFLLAQRLLQQAGIRTLIADPAECEARAEGLYCAGSRVDLVYNRLTDFSLQRHPALLAAWQQRQVVVTPHPENYARFADKRNLARLSDAPALRALGAGEDAIGVLQAGLPETRAVHGADHDQWWADRKHWFFKPATGYGAKAAYRGASITRRVFDEIMHHEDYVAQRLAPPGERMVCVGDAEPAPYKADVRCYVYEGKVQLVAARLYQGQTTNFRTPGGGFAPVRIA